MDELVKKLMSATPIVSQISKRTGLSMEQLDQVVRITPCVVIDDDGDEMITFLDSTTAKMLTKSGFMAEAYEFGIARLHSEYCINPEKAEKKVRLALEDEFKQLNWAATADAVCDTTNELVIEKDALKSEIENNAANTETGRKVRANKGAQKSKDDAEDLKKKVIDAWLKKGYSKIWETGERAEYGSIKHISRIVGCCDGTVKRILKKMRLN